MKFIISWDAGYGDSHEEVDVENEEEALKWAYENWKEEAESSAVYGVVGEATDELREEHL